MTLLSGATEWPSWNLIRSVLVFLPILVALPLLPVGCSSLSTQTARSSDSGLVLRSQLLARLPVQQGTIAGLADPAAPVFLSLNDCVLAGVQQFRHPLGLHTVQSPADSPSFLVVLAPPALSRAEQLVFHRDLQQHVLRIRQAYWSVGFSVKQHDLWRSEGELLQPLIESQHTERQSNQFTRWQADTLYIQRLDLQLRALQVNSYTSPIGSVEDSLNRLLKLCGLPDTPGGYIATDSPDGLAPSSCLECDVEHGLSMNPDLLIQRFHWIEMQRQMETPAKSSLDYFLPFRQRERKTPSLPNTAFDLAVQREQEVEMHMRKLHSQIAASLIASDLIDRKSEILLANRELLKERDSGSQATRDEVLRLELQVVQAHLESLVAVSYLQALSDQYTYETGRMSQIHSILEADFWLTETSTYSNCPIHAETGLGNPLTTAAEQFSGTELHEVVDIVDR